MKKNILILILSLILIIGMSLSVLGAQKEISWQIGSEPPSLDPCLATDSISIDMVENLFLGLTDLAYDINTSETTVMPELATDWEVSEDGLVWAFHMRKDVVWSDGKPVTAHDVEYAVRRTCDPATASDYAYVLYIIKGAKEVNTGEITDLSHIGVKAIDDYTIQFALNHPAGYFPSIAGMWVARPVPKWAIEKYGDSWTEAGKIVTNGPYLLKEWKHEDEIVMAKNPKFYDADKVDIDIIHSVIVVEDSTAMAMYEAGELDSTPCPLEDIDRVKADPVLSKEYVNMPDVCTYYYGFNTTKPPFDNALVRKAFSAAIDRQSLIDFVLKGGQSPATTFTCPGMFGHIPPSEGVGIPFNKEAARKYLADAGYPEGKGLPEITLMFNTSEAHGKIAQAIQQMWKENLGVDVNITNQEWAVYLKTTIEDPPQIWRMGWCADYADANNWVYENFHSTDSDNRVRWNNPEFDRVVEQAARESDPKKRYELYKRSEQILCEEVAAIAPIYFYTVSWMVKPHLYRTFSPLGGQHFNQWKIIE
ncbi:MAG TPA: peptide ABC transporter substrate-binding protein [Candidatus Atribacteria bacterium]|nr:peptide ABC transporter substrate-binding protein [Candidatus Atribacteria bacterium]